MVMDYTHDDYLVSGAVGVLTEAEWRLAVQNQEKNRTQSSGGQSTTHAGITGGPSAPQTTTTGSLPTAQQTRAAQYANFDGWSNDPVIRGYQEQDLAIYVATGRWDTAEQNELHAAAEARRRGLNPVYTGSDTGPRNSGEAAGIVLPDSQSIGGPSWGVFAIAGLAALIILR